MPLDAPSCPRRLLLAVPLLALARAGRAEWPAPAPAGQAAALLLRWPGGSAVLDRAVLDASPREVLRTHTPWTRGPQLFEGRPLLPLLPEALLRAPLLVAVGLDDYRAEIPAEDVQRHGLFLAWRRNGVLLTVRDRGPFWLLYPWSARPGLDLPLFHRRAVWQLRLIEAA